MTMTGIIKMKKIVISEYKLLIWIFVFGVQVFEYNLVWQQNIILVLYDYTVDHVLS